MDMGVPAVIHDCVFAAVRMLASETVMALTNHVVAVFNINNLVRMSDLEPLQQ